LFALGAAFYVNREFVPVSGWILSALALLCAATFGTWAFSPLLALTTGYFALCFAYRTRWFAFNRLGDYSYGMYLWNWPVQQALAHWFEPESALAMFAASFPIILLLAVISWHVLEKPALALRRRVSQRPGTTAAAAGPRVPHTAD